MSVERVFCEVVEVDVEAYPGGKRPMAVVVLAWRGEVGRGENVSWTLAVQDRFAASVGELLMAKSGAVSELVSPEADPYAHAALESALVDLALRQAGKSLFEIAEVEGSGVIPVRYVVSFDAVLDPGARLAEIQAHNVGARFRSTSILSGATPPSPSWSRPSRSTCSTSRSVATRRWSSVWWRPSPTPGSRTRPRTSMRRWRGWRATSACAPPPTPRASPSRAR
ncbi:MAG: hypothetical protein IPK07_20225 [Deltaproteobacteria bacterium]|nr:hypothetical protein [Deltaproteobacteria bacterium]